MKLSHKGTTGIFPAISWLILLLASCNTEKEADPSQLGYPYYPLAIGNYYVYDVEEINFSLLEGADTSHYQLKEVVEDYFHQNREDTSYYLYRYSRGDEAGDWQLDSIWTVRKDQRRIVVVENNVPFIKLVFPLRQGLTWDANGMNAEEETLYSVKEIGGTFEAGGESYPNTLHIVEKDNMDTVITERYREAVYAADIGLVYKEQRAINYCATTVECLGQGIIESGRKYVQLLSAYGKE